MERRISEQEQLDIIKEVEEKYSKFLDPNFDASVFLECRDNFALTSHIESVKIFEMDNPPSNPTFTIAIPTYNRCETLKEAIDSALAQETDEHYEIIVVENVDDFDEKTKAQEMLEKEYKGKLTYYKNRKNLGMSGNWNRCLTLAQGEWVSILHSDDRLLSQYLFSLSSILQNKKKYIAIGCQAEFLGYKASLFSEEANLWQKTKSGLLSLRKFDERHSIGEIKHIQISACLFNKKRAIDIGGFASIDYPMPDTLFFTRAYRKGSILLYRKKLVIKNTDIACSSNPKTALETCFLVQPMTQIFSLPDVYFYLKGCQDSMKDTAPLLWKYSQDFNQKINPTKLQVAICKLKIKIKRLMYILGIIK